MVAIEVALRSADATVGESEARAAPALTEIPVDGLPIARDVRTVFQGGTFLLLLLGGLYFAAEIVLPIVLACVLMLVLQPLMRILARWYVPRGMAALGIIVMLFGSFAGLSAALSGPAVTWTQKLPDGIPKLQERLKFLSKPIAAFQKLALRAEGLAPGAVESKPVAVQVEGTGLSARLLSGTRNLASGLLVTVLVLFFLLISGEMFLRRLVEILPTFKNKRQAVDISNQIESDISAYLLTITLMNAAVGIATGAAVALTGLGDPLLWGTIAFLLNFVPILGPMIAVVIFLVAGLLSIEPLWLAFVPAGLYLGIHIIGGRDHHADAPRAPLHYKSSASHRLAGFLVLDVGRTGSNPCDANAGDYQDRLRPHRVANTVRAFHRGLTAGKLHRENLGEACGDYTSWFRRAYDMAVAALASSRLRHRQGASITFAPNRRVIHRNSA